MNLIRKNLRLIAVAVACAGIGAGVSAIASAGASTTSSAQKTRALRSGRGLRALRRAVEGNLVVATKTGFATVTFQRGMVKSVNGRQLTLAEGTRTKTYKTITLTIPAAAKVRDNGKSATLANVAVGQRALVVRGPKLTHVIARTPRTR